MLNNLIRVLTIIAISATFSIIPTQAYAANSALMDLIQILKNKGSITEEEFQLLQKAAVAEGQQQTAPQQAATVTAPETKTAVAEVKPAPASWTNKISLRGDARLRYQTQDNDPGISRRDRSRIRYRLGVIAQPTEGWEVGGGMASNVPDLRSANQTFTDTFSRKPLGLDYAYIQHNFNDSFKAVGGKFRFPAYLYTSSDHLWDGDINPEGFSVNYSHKSDLGTTFINGGNWTLAENGNNGKDPYMLYGQAGQTFKHGNVFGTVAGTYYSFKEVLSRNAFTNAGSNTDYHFGGIYAVAGEIGLTDMLETGIKTSIIADWTHNSDTTSAEDTSHLLGVKFAEGPWTLRHAYSDIERNAWPDIFPDSERFDGLTGTKGYEIVFEYELMTNVLLALDYYSMERSVINTDQDLFHIDLNVRF